MLGYIVKILDAPRGIDRDKRPHSVGDYGKVVETSRLSVQVKTAHDTMQWYLKDEVEVYSRSPVDLILVHGKSVPANKYPYYTEEGNYPFNNTRDLRDTYIKVTNPTDWNRAVAFYKERGYVFNAKTDPQFVDGMSYVVARKEDVLFYGLHIKAAGKDPHYPDDAKDITTKVLFNKQEPKIVIDHCSLEVGDQVGFTLLKEKEIIGCKCYNKGEYFRGTVKECIHNQQTYYRKEDRFRYTTNYKFSTDKGDTLTLILGVDFEVNRIDKAADKKKESFVKNSSDLKNTYVRINDATDWNKALHFYNDRGYFFERTAPLYGPAFRFLHAGKLSDILFINQLTPVAGATDITDKVLGVTGKTKLSHEEFCKEFESFYIPNQTPDMETQSLEQLKFNKYVEENKEDIVELSETMDNALESLNEIGQIFGDFYVKVKTTSVAMSNAFEQCNKSKLDDMFFDLKAYEGIIFSKEYKEAAAAVRTFEKKIQAFSSK